MTEPAPVGRAADRLSDHKSVPAAIPNEMHDRIVEMAARLGCDSGEALGRAIEAGLVVLRAKGEPHIYEPEHPPGFYDGKRREGSDYGGYGPEYDD